MAEIPIDGTALTLADIAAVARSGATARLTAEAHAAVERAAGLVVDLVASGRPAYGITTGFGALSDRVIPTDQLRALQANLLRSHNAGIGEPFDDPTVRAMLLLRANTLARGHSGVRPIVIERLLAMLAARVHPVVPCQGSVGASGDLAPLAHLALPLMGEGEVRHRGRVRPAAEVLAELGWKPLELGPKEGLALINGTQASVAVGALAVLDAGSLLAHADIAGALTLQCLRGRRNAFDARIHALRPIPGQVTAAGNIRRLLAGSGHLASDDSRQDPYCLRCMPQVHGAAREMVATARRILAIEINAVTDNPLLFPGDGDGDGDVLSGGNFHGEPIAQSLDGAAIGVTSLSTIAERRLDRLVAGTGPELAMFLSPSAGVSSGFMIVHVAAAALTSENKHLAAPASVDSIPTSAGQEDHVSFSTWAARKLAQVVTNTRNVLASEILAGCQALEARGTAAASPAARAVHAVVRERVPPLLEDRVMHPDVAAVADIIQSDRLVEAVGPID